MGKLERRKKRVVFIILFLLSISMCFPIFLLLGGSFMSKGEISGYLAPILKGGKEYVSWSIIPMYPTIQSYIKLFFDTPEFFVMFWNTMKITFFTLFGQLIFAVPAAWGFARYKFPLKKILFTIYIVLMLMPFQVTMLSNYIVLDKIHLLDTHWSIILPAAFSTFPVFIMYTFFHNIHDAIIEAARIDGASEMQIFFKIGIPLGMPGIMASMILNFFEYWSLIEQPMTFLETKALLPLSLYLPNITLENADIAFVSSAVASIMAITVFLAGQKYLQQGIAASAVKE